MKWRWGDGDRDVSIGACRPGGGDREAGCSGPDPSIRKALVRDRRCRPRTLSDQGVRRTCPSSGLRRATRCPPASSSWSAATARSRHRRRRPASRDTSYRRSAGDRPHARCRGFGEAGRPAVATGPPAHPAALAGLPSAGRCAAGAGVGRGGRPPVRDRRPQPRLGGGNRGPSSRACRGCRRPHHDLGTSAFDDRGSLFSG